MRVLLPCSFVPRRESARFHIPLKLTRRDGETTRARVTLKDGRALDGTATVEPPRPSAILIGKSAQLAPSGQCRLGASPAADTGVLREDLEAAVGTLLRAFAGPLKQALPGLVADMAHDAELADAIREEVLTARRESMREAFARAHARNGIRDDLDIELMLDTLTGPFY
jgi:hypothetical protein